MDENSGGVPKPPRRKVDLENWANNDITPDMPSPGQPMEQKKKKG